MNTLYLIGGPPRTGKSTIMMDVIKKHPMPAYSFDAIRNGLRNAIFGEGYVTFKDLSFSGKVAFQRPGETHIQHKDFSQSGVREEPLTWKAVEGIIDLYNRDRIGSDIIVEGVGIYPHLAHQLPLGNMTIRAAFLGITSESHADNVLEYSRANKDWVNTWLNEVNGDESIIRDWIKTEVTRSQKDKKLAEEYGYGFFDASAKPFEQYVQEVSDYLLNT